MIALFYVVGIFRRISRNDRKSLLSLTLMPPLASQNFTVAKPPPVRNTSTLLIAPPDTTTYKRSPSFTISLTSQEIGYSHICHVNMTYKKIIEKAEHILFR